jgi:hypothetical protein
MWFAAWGRVVAATGRYTPARSIGSLRRRPIAPLGRSLMDTLLSQKVYDQLYAALLDHRLKPGDRRNRRQVPGTFRLLLRPPARA